MGINSQPRIQSTAAPLFVPLAQDTALLGGTSGVLAIAVRLAPGLVVGLPTLVGLDPLPVDPSLVPVDPVADVVSDLPLPSPPPLGCTSNLPDDPQEAECGGGSQDFFGYRVGAASARTVAEGDTDDRSTLASRSDASVADVSPSGGQPLMPVRFATLGATAEGGIIDGRAVTTASAAVSGLDVAGQFTLDAVEANYSGAAGGTAESLDEAFECRLAGAAMGGERIDLRTDALTILDDDVPLPLGEALGALSGAVAGGGGEVGPADIGNVVITPNPEPVTEVSADGTSVRRRFGCLEIRYRIKTSGTDVRLTLGNVAVSMNAFVDEPFAAESTDSTESTDSFEDAAPVAGTDVQNAGLGGGPPASGDSQLALPAPPTAGAQAPEPSEQPFVRSINRTAGWGIDGGWMAPFALLALSIPLLAKARTFAPVPRPTRG
ncbi:MAG: hypothetical protein S0880_32890 [Actinomycetota bacterium]|nr:hypothetical protein [Actinomycetota bacterium]